LQASDLLMDSLADGLEVPWDGPIFNMFVTLRVQAVLTRLEAADADAASQARQYATDLFDVKQFEQPTARAAERLQLVKKKSIVQHVSEALTHYIAEFERTRGTQRRHTH
jgi:hypothetical protein